MKKVIIALLIGFLLAACAEQTIVRNDLTAVASDKTVVFKVQMPAREIFLAGSFNAWKIKDTKYQFQSKDGKTWELTLPESLFKKGRNEYKLIVDGDWKINPAEKVEDSALSGKINILEIH